MTPPRATDRAVLLSWGLLSLLLAALAAPTISQTGLDYDEAVYGHLAKDFLLDRSCPQHMPGSVSFEFAGRPAPFFVQGYLGAVKCWVLIPSFAIWGTSVAVMRWTMLAFGLLGILFLMLWARRILNFPAAVLVGFLTALDPVFFFPTICEWGAFVPSFVCRCAGLLCLTLWWRKRQLVWSALAGAAFGLGFFNKIDFVVILVALWCAGLAAGPREVIQNFRVAWKHWLAGALAFLLAGAPMIWNSLRWLTALMEVQAGARNGELTTKLNIAGAALDGSYFSRLTEAGGLFHRMFERPVPVGSVFGVGLGLCVMILLIKVIRASECRWSRFFLVGLLITTLGFFLLPDALRIHHFLIIYPFPQLIIVTAVVLLWQGAELRSIGWLGKATATVLIGSILIGHVVNLRRTQQFIATTGGRGQWALEFTRFAAPMRDRADVRLVSLDWGFHEQLSFLTDKPQCFEPTWNLQAGQSVSLLPDPSYYYLIHPAEFSLFPYGERYLQIARESGRPFEFESFTNREGQVVFQYFRFKSP